MDDATTDCRWEVETDPEQVRGVLAAIAPIVGTAATGRIVEALAVAIEIVEMEEESNEGGAR